MHESPDGPVPSPSIPAPASRRRPLWPWITALLAAAVLAAAYWVLDVPNRVHAAQAIKDARVALLGSDYPRALAAFRTAALARPTDESIAREYDQAQVRWLEIVDRKLDRLAPGEAYRTLQSLPTTTTLLIEPHAGAYRQRADRITAEARTLAESGLADAKQKSADGDFAGAYQGLKQLEPFAALLPGLADEVRAVQVAEVEQAMASARNAQAEGKNLEGLEALKSVAGLAKGVDGYDALVQSLRESDTTAALTAAAKFADAASFAEMKERLDYAAGTGVLADRVTEAREALRQRARQWARFHIARGIHAKDRAELTNALETARTYGGWEHTLTAETFLAETDLELFLKALTAFDIGGAQQAESLERYDLALVLAARKQFKDPEAVNAFLRDGFAAWSRAHSNGKLHGFALFLDELSGKFGAKRDNEWRIQEINRGAGVLNITLGVKLAKTNPASPPKFEAEAQAAFTAALKRRLPSWPVLLEGANAGNASVVFLGEFQGVATNDDDRNVERRSVRYQSGTQQVPNAARQAIVAEHNELLEDLKRLNRSIAEHREIYQRSLAGEQLNSAEQPNAAGAAGALPFEESRAREIRAQLAEMRERGDAMPKLLDEPVYSDESYRYIRHTYTYTAEWRVSAVCAGEPVDPIWQWTSSMTSQSDEVAGNASHGVPVKKPQVLPKEKTLPTLAPKLVAELAKNDNLLQDIPELTLHALELRLNQEKVAPYVQADRILALTFAWDRMNHPLEGRAEIMHGAAQLLSLSDS